MQDDSNPKQLAIWSILSPVIGIFTFFIISIILPIGDTASLGSGIMLIGEILLIALTIGLILGVLSALKKEASVILSWLGILLNGVPLCLLITDIIL